LLKKRSAGRFDDRELNNVAKDCDGMSMAYVQEVVVNALLHAIHAGRDPQNGDLVRSLRALKQQQKNVKNIYDTGVPDKAKGIGFGQDDDDMYDPWDPEREVPGWR